MRGDNTKPEANSWRARAEEAEAELEDLRARLDEIADIAAPERAETDARIERIDRTIAILARAFLNGQVSAEDAKALDEHLVDTTPKVAAEG